MATHYSENYRRKVVSNYQQLWAEQSLSIDDYSRQVCVHHTTLRQWLKKYAPDFEAQRKSLSRQRVAPTEPDLIAELDTEPSGQCKTQTQSVTVQTEWYRETDPQQDDLIQQLRDEIVFLKKQVQYWMRQEAIA